MQKIGDALLRLTTSLGPKDSSTRIARRVAQVQTMFKDTIEHLYKSNAAAILSHVNAVYIMNDKQKRKSLIVYMDDGCFRSDVHSQQHFILLRFLQKYNEHIEVFKTYPSRFSMRTRHPYQDVLINARSRLDRVKPLDDVELAHIESLGKKVQDTELRASLIKAMRAEKEWRR